MGSLYEGLRIMVIGMGIVFLILFILYLVMIAIKKVFYKEERPSINADNSLDNTQEEEEDVIEVLTAAVCCVLQEPEYNLKVRAFREVDRSGLTWNTVGRKEQLESRIRKTF